ncbi:MAG: PspA/IM30 family protein [Sphaerochaeta sp.]
MNVFSRVMDIVNSNINSLLDKAEDPEKMIRLMIKEMEDTIIESKTACAAKMAEEKRIIKKADELKSSIKRWESRAVLAISNGKDDLAKEALIEKKNCINDLNKKENELVNIGEYIKESKEDINKLEEKLKATKAKHKAIQERAKHVEEERKAQEALHNADKYSFDDINEKIDRMASMNDLNKDTTEETLEQKFAKMEGMSDIERELDELKKKLEN